MTSASTCASACEETGAGFGSYIKSAWACCRDATFAQVYRHLYRYVYGHVYGHVYRHVYRHAHRHAYRHVKRHCIQTCEYTCYRGATFGHLWPLGSNGPSVVMPPLDICARSGLLLRGTAAWTAQNIRSNIRSDLRLRSRSNIESNIRLSVRLEGSRTLYRDLSAWSERRSKCPMCIAMHVATGVTAVF